MVSLRSVSALWYPKHTYKVCIKLPSGIRQHRFKKLLKLRSRAPAPAWHTATDTLTLRPFLLSFAGDLSAPRKIVLEDFEKELDRLDDLPELAPTAKSSAKKAKPFETSRRNYDTLYIGNERCNIK